MSNSIQDQILTHLKGGSYRPVKPRGLAKQINLTEGNEYHAFRDALRELMHQGRVVLGAGGYVVLPSAQSGASLFVGTYRHNPRGFGFVVPTDPGSHEDLFIPEGENGGAITGDIVRAKITNQEQRQGKTMYRGRVMEIVSRTQKRFVGSLVKQHGQWLVLPDGNTLTAPISTPDAAGRHVKPGSKVVVELTHYPEPGQNAQGVITEILGQAGEKDVDLKTVIVQFNLPGEFPPETLDQARHAVDRFNDALTTDDRVDLSDQIICTIDPDDAKDFDDAISLSRNNAGEWELGVHIADVAFFIPSGSPLDEEAKERGNSCYFPGHVIPMLPEILSNGVCSLQADVGRFCKSAFITFDEAARPISTRFANTIIRSAARLRYREAQAILDRAETIPHPDGPRNIEDYSPAVVELLHQMNSLAKKIQKRRLAAGQIVLELPEVELVLDDNRKVIGTEPEDESFTHTLIEMFMVEANEAVARLLDSIDVPFLRRIHPDPDLEHAARLRNFVQASGYPLPKDLDRKAIQQLLSSVRGKPESFAVNLAVLKSLSRAEYSPRNVGHYALASKQYSHFTSPIRRYSDLTVHRLLDQYLRSSSTGKSRKPHLEDIPSFDNLVELGKHLSFTERRADDAERELRQIKLLELLQHQVGEDFAGVITGITSFGIFIQLSKYLIDGLVRYEDLMDDWWDVDERAGQVRGQRTGRVIGIGDLVTARIARVDPPRRQLDLVIAELKPRPGRPAAWRLDQRQPEKTSAKKPKTKNFKTRRPHAQQGRRGRR
jgi:ribonuclease R